MSHSLPFLINMSIYIYPCTLFLDFTLRSTEDVDRRCLRVKLYFFCASVKFMTNFRFPDYRPYLVNSSSWLQKLGLSLKGSGYWGPTITVYQTKISSLVRVALLCKTRAGITVIFTNKKLNLQKQSHSKTVLF